MLRYDLEKPLRYDLEKPLGTSPFPELRSVSQEILLTTKVAEKQIF
jgi:hypothetical protein